jgi:hypothetical protein
VAARGVSFVLVSRSCIPSCIRSPRMHTPTHSPACPPRRQDLRHLCVCSVDPPGCKDIDDALHMRRVLAGACGLA